MKMAIFKDKKSKNSSRLNIHFGKVILVLLLVLGQVLIQPKYRVSASQIRTWKVYSREYFKIEGSNVTLMSKIPTAYYPLAMTGGLVTYEDKVFVNTYYIDDTGNNLTVGEANAILPLNEQQIELLRNPNYDDFTISEYGTKTLSGNNVIFRHRPVVAGYKKGEYRRTVTAPEGTYPSQGVFGDEWLELELNPGELNHIWKRHHAFMGGFHKVTNSFSGDRNVTTPIFRDNREVYASWETVNGDGVWVNTSGSILFPLGFPPGVALETKNSGLIYPNWNVRIYGTFKSKKGTFIENVEAPPGKYPVDGPHTDGYWYTYVGLANNDPTITTTSPVQNSYFGKQIVAYRL